MTATGPEDRGPAEPAAGRFRTEAEIAETLRRLDASVDVTPQGSSSRTVVTWLAALLVAIALAMLAFTLAWSGPRWSSFALTGVLLIPIGFLLLSIGKSGREDVGLPLCRTCRHALPPQALPKACSECGASLRSPWSVVRDGRAVRKPAWIIAGVACLLIGILSNTWPLFGLNRALPNRTLIGLIAASHGSGQDWDEVARRSLDGRWSAVEIDELAGIAVAELDGNDLASFQIRAFLETEWMAGRLSPARQQECLRLAYRLSLERRGPRLALVASKRLYPRPAPSLFQRLAIGTVAVDGTPVRVVHRVLGHDQVPYLTETPGSIAIDLGDLPTGTGPITVDGFVLSSPFARGTAEWDAAQGLLDLDPSVLAAPFMIELPR